MMILLGRWAGTGKRKTDTSFRQNCATHFNITSANAERTFAKVEFMFSAYALVRMACIISDSVKFGLSVVYQLFLLV